MTTTSLPRVLVWNEYRHEKRSPAVAAIYPDGIHEALAEPLRQAGFTVHTATLDEPEHGLTEAVLDETDVLVWWGHMAHPDVQDEIVDRITACWAVWASWCCTPPISPSCSSG